MPNWSRIHSFAAIAFAAAATSAWGAETETLAANPLAATQNGVSLNADGAFAGYSLVAPMNQTSTYLVDMQGRIVHEWKSEYTPALSVYLLPSGHLLRPAVNRGARIFDIPAVGGRIQEFDWDGNLVWDFVFEREGTSPHHDICPLPNGNVLMIATEAKTKEEVLEIGRRPESLGERLLVDCVLEIKPTGPTTGEVVWEWHAWDHLIQDTDPEKPKYGEIAEHPGRIDVNFGSRAFAAMTADPQQLAQLRTLGYVGGGAPGPNNAPGGAPPTVTPPADGASAAPSGNNPPPGAPRGGPRGPGIDGDWMHTNSIAYHAELDQIMLSVHGFSEVWIIDHGTTTAEAATHAGGRRGKGGDLLYRWGNPQAYRSGTQTDQQFFGQHCAHWIAPGLPGAGHMLVFNNGLGRRNGSFSSVDEVVLPLNADGTYDRDEFLSFGPEKAAWSYTSPDKSSFNSMLVSGAHRLPNGNTFVCSGNQSILFEVTHAGEIVWVYKHPGGGMGFPGFDGGRMGMFPDFVRRMLQVDDEQGKMLTALQADVDKQLADILSAEQLRRVEQPFRPPFGGPPGAGGPPRDGRPPEGDSPRNDRPDANAPQDRGPGRRGPRGGGPTGFRAPRFGDVIPFFVVGSLELTDEQQARIAKVQESVDSQLKGIMTDDQRTQIENMSRAFAGGFGPPGGNRPGAPPDGNRPRGDDDPPRPPDQSQPNGDRPPRPDGPRPGGNSPGGFGPGRGGPGFGPMFGGGGPGGGPGGFFRSYRYSPDFPGLAGRELTPGQKLEEIATPQRPPERSRPPAEEDGRNENAQ